jgi:2-dehydropantoate 2-reductase
MRTALVGAGSMGTVIGALLTKGGEDIVLVDVNEEHIRAMNDKGARITGHMELAVPVKAITPDRMDGIYDLIIYLVKTTYDDQALPQILPYIDDNSGVITLQNGVPEEKVASVVGRERTMGGAIGWGATWLAPGASELTSDKEAMTYDIGELDGSNTARIKAVKEVLDKAGTTTISSNLPGVRWTKLLINVSLSGMSAALGCTFGEVMDNDKAAAAATSIIIETLKTAKALGITAEPMSGADPNIILDVAGQKEEDAVNLVRMVTQSHRDLKASMLQDLEKGLPCEVETLNGYLSRKSAEAGVPTPVNDKVTEIIRGIEAGRYPLSFDNLEMIEVRPLQEII